jgi:murein DD-endopeptidase MepM/ murein hydrolase activator NlpD
VLITAGMIITLPQSRRLAPVSEAPGAISSLAAQPAAPFARQRGFAGAPLNAFGTRPLIGPVAGVTTRDLVDTWGQARSQGRSHEGIDIMAAMDTPVQAAAPGKIARFFRSERGGLTIYQLDESGKFILYYAHLAGYMPTLREGDVVKQGQVIGYVGSTGNATTPHLHFEIQRASTDGRWWHAEAMNPYPPLMAGRIE